MSETTNRKNKSKINKGVLATSKAMSVTGSTNANQTAIYTLNNSTISPERAFSSITNSSSFFAIGNREKKEYKDRIKKYMRPFVQETNFHKQKIDQMHAKRSSVQRSSSPKKQFYYVR